MKKTLSILVLSLMFVVTIKAGDIPGNVIPPPPPPCEVNCTTTNSTSTTTWLTELLLALIAKR